MGYILGDFFTNSSGHPGVPLKSAKPKRLQKVEDVSTHFMFAGVDAVNSVPSSK
jgi:hypothetical protein